MRALLALLCLSLGAQAQAQQIKPRLLLVFDTSGSMGYDIDTGRATGGDNSEAYPGAGTSRLYVAKEVIREVVSFTSEVDFALMRYPQREGLGLNDGVGREMVNAYEGLDALPLNYLGACGGDLFSEEGAFAVVSPFEADNEVEILRWLDHREDWPRDPELRAEGPTPLVESLRLAEGYFQALLAEDQAARCRRYHVVLLTDGAESCVPDEVEAAQRLRAQTVALRQIQVEIDGEQIRPHVQVFVIAFATAPDVSSRLDEIARIGGTAMNEAGEIDTILGRAARATDQAGLRRAFSRVLAEAIPQEVCNGVDDDCDGLIDEGVTNPCGQCGPTPVERCNGLDDDCDGEIDEDFPQLGDGCNAGVADCVRQGHMVCDARGEGLTCDALPGAGAVEVCNGVDDDCDGLIDNTPHGDQPLSRPCSVDIGACQIGQEICEGGRWGACDGVGPVEELCDGIDNDCDGFIDGQTRPCGPLELGEVGQCRLGRAACVEGAWAEACEGAVEPEEERCDHVDNDCDGEVDEGLYNACGQCGPPPLERCNGLDDDCDGAIDEGAPCPEGFLCALGACVAPCDTTGECPEGRYCATLWVGGRFCHPDPCAYAQCPEGEICASAGACVDPCVDVRCPEGHACELGGCVPMTCRHQGCPAGQRCEPGGCAPDPCLEADCAADEFCDDGACIKACLGVACGPGRRCEGGVCVEDPCGGRCLPGQVCVEAEALCAEDPCARIDCPPGTACEGGACDQAAACVQIRCPLGTVCRAGQCTDEAPSVEPDLTVGLPDGLAPLPPQDSGVAPTPTPDAGQVSPDADADAPRATPSDDGCQINPRGGRDPIAAMMLLALLAFGARRRP
ncbi:hypothetical protein KKF91_03855 [Myxococcota bacterium]|nr:hypothetical protein [Myxococcota bacterium]